MPDSTVNNNHKKASGERWPIMDIVLKAAATILLGLLFNDIRIAMLKIERLQEWAAQWKNYPSDRRDLEISILREVDTKIKDSLQTIQMDVRANSVKLDTILRLQRGQPEVHP